MKFFKKSVSVKRPRNSLSPSACNKKKKTDMAPNSLKLIVMLKLIKLDIKCGIIEEAVDPKNTQPKTLFVQALLAHHKALLQNKKVNIPLSYYPARTTSYITRLQLLNLKAEKINFSSDSTTETATRSNSPLKLISDLLSKMSFNKTSNNAKNVSSSSSTSFKTASSGGSTPTSATPSTSKAPNPSTFPFNIRPKPQGYTDSIHDQMKRRSSYASAAASNTTRGKCNNGFRPKASTPRQPQASTYKQYRQQKDKEGKLAKITKNATQKITKFFYPNRHDEAA